jgi:hypothetical protein
MTSEMNSTFYETGTQVDEPESTQVDELESIKQELKPFAQALTEDIEKKPICKATAYELAIAMIADIVIKILDYQEKKFIFPKKVITGLWNIHTEKDSLNLIGILYQFMTICGSYPDAEFKKSTYGAIISRKPSPDINYNLDPKQAYIPLKDCKFILLLKIFRTIIGHSIKNTTGKYSMPSEEFADKWRYMIVDENRQQHFVSSEEFIQYTLEIGEIYVELEKLSASLSEIYEIFNEAAAASKIEKEKKLQMIEARALRQMKSKYYVKEKEERFQQKTKHTKQFTSSAYVSSSTESVDWKKVDAIPAPKPVWGKINPVTGTHIKSSEQPVITAVAVAVASEAVSSEAVAGEAVASEAVAFDDDVNGDDGFQTVRVGRVGRVGQVGRIGRKKY